MSETLSVKPSTAVRQHQMPEMNGSILVAEGYDNTIRWQSGQRLHHLLEGRLKSDGERPALDVDGVSITFAEFDQRANQMARYFLANGFGAGDRIGLIVDRSIAAYVALLAVLKIDAAYVPLDAKFPTDRIAYIAGDARIKAFVTTDVARPLVAELGLPVFELTEAAKKAGKHLRSPLDVKPVERPADQLCYIIYTSGSTGRPKGVAVNHSSICNFVSVASEVYGYVPDDRVYQGMTLAFDFSVEELWVPLIAGATLVPSPADRQMVGDDLASFLSEKRITAMCCVPTLLATISDDLPGLRLLLVSGEACPPDIVARWQRSGRRMLNAYGPTEATVTATWTEVSADKAVTIGVPLPTYTVAILEVGRDALVEDGEPGEITIAGVGLAEGYVNRADLTANAFVPDFLQLTNNPSRRLYRTGDLGRINEDGQIEYHGRIDTQVKIRGYRIELAEIENVLLEVDGISQAVATTYEAEPGQVELAAYYTCFEEAECPSRQQLVQVMRSRLPGYMVPAFVEELDEMPLLASHKVDRKALPAPSAPRLVRRPKELVAPGNETERVIAECLAKTLGLDAVSVDDHFFEDLGAHSLLMGQFLAALNKEMANGRAAISDVYLAPSVALLAKELDARREKDTSSRRVVEPGHVASDAEHFLCGALQAAFYVCQYAFNLGLFTVGIWWASAAATNTDLALRALVYSAGGLLLLMALPVAAKWLLIGRWRQERIPIWSMKYFRFWAVRQLMTVSPWFVFRGTALFNVFLRLLGAKIGHGVLILTDRMPLATDLISIGDNTVLRRHAMLSGYRADNGFIEIGPITIGARAVVGERGFVDAGTSIGDDGQLAHASAILSGQSIPEGQRWHGSPARQTEANFLHLPFAPTSRARRTVFATARLGLVLFAATIAIAFPVSIAPPGGSGALGEVSFSFWQVIKASMVVFIGGYLLAFAAHLTVPRLLRLLLTPGRVYPLYGFHHYVAQLLGAIGYSPLFQILFGDSSGIVHYFKWLGISQPNPKQTGSNFGTATSYESPFEVEVGSGSMVSDGLWIINIELGCGTFRLVEARIGQNSFLGNVIVFPPDAKLGDNYLLGTKTMVPTDGKVRENVGLLGSPAFEIPREVVDGDRFNPVPTTDSGRARLRAKNAFNFRTALLHLASHWILLLGLMMIAAAAVSLYGSWGTTAFVSGLAVAPFWVIAHSIIVERLSLAGVKMRPHNCTIHDPYFWWIERHWKLGETLAKDALAGTPFRPMVLRAVGLKIGRKVYDDGAGIAEKPLVEIGDNCCINADTSIQGHSLEDGLFKSDRIVIGAGSTIGPASFVHYGVNIGPNTVLSPDAFLMKGAITAPASYWQGNPARVV